MIIRQIIEGTTYGAFRDGYFRLLTAGAPNVQVATWDRTNTPIAAYGLRDRATKLYRCWGIDWRAGTQEALDMGGVGTAMYYPPWQIGWWRLPITAVTRQEGALTGEWSIDGVATAEWVVQAASPTWSIDGVATAEWEVQAATPPDWAIDGAATAEWIGALRGAEWSIDGAAAAEWNGLRAHRVSDWRIDGVANAGWVGSVTAAAVTWSIDGAATAEWLVDASGKGEICMSGSGELGGGEETNFCF